MTARRSIMSWMSATLVSLLVACGGAPVGVVTSVTMSLDDTSLWASDVVQADVLVEAEGGASEDVSWSSSDTSVAIVGPTGQVTAVGAGTAQVTATSVFDASVSDSVTVTVQHPLDGGVSVLYYLDVLQGTDTLAIALGLAEQEHGLSFTYTTTSDFVTDLADDPDLLVYLANSTTPTDAHTAALVDWVEAGRPLIFTTWSANANSNQVLEAMGSSYGDSSNHGAVAVTDLGLQPGLSSSTLPTSNPDNHWATYNLGLQAAEGSEVVATYEDDDIASIVLGNQGLSATVGFLTDTVPVIDGARLYFNLITRVMRAAVGD